MLQPANNSLLAIIYIPAFKSYNATLVNYPVFNMEKLGDFQTASSASPPAILSPTCDTLKKKHRPSTSQERKKKQIFFFLVSCAKTLIT